MTPACLICLDAKSTLSSIASPPVAAFQAAVPASSHGIMYPPVKLCSWTPVKLSEGAGVAVAGAAVLAAAVGAALGAAVGATLGAAVGATLGAAVGATLGAGVAAALQAARNAAPPASRPPWRTWRRENGRWISDWPSLPSCARTTSGILLEFDPANASPAPRRPVCHAATEGNQPFHARGPNSTAWARARE